MLRTRHMRIGILAAKTDTSVETLRYYEAEGLIPEPPRSDSGYRLYATGDVRRVIFIRRARDMGFSLKETRELLSLQLDKEAATCGQVKMLAHRKLALIDEKILELNKMRAALQQVTQACAGGKASAVHCTILGALESYSEGGLVEGD